MGNRAASWVSEKGLFVAFATPRKLPKPASLAGRVVVLDIAFASESGGRRNDFDSNTLPFIEALGERLAAWVDHHDSVHHRRFATDARFVLATKAQHGACPEMVTAEFVARVGAVDTLVCHTDFDGLASAAKWLLGGREPYPGCDDDARAIDTRKGFPSGTGAQLDRAIRARPRDEAVLRAVLSLLAGGLAGDGWEVVEAAAREIAPREEEAGRLSHRYEIATPELVLVDVDVAGRAGPYDKTSLLLLGQERARMACVVDGDTATFAAAYDSGVDFLARFGLSGGMPTMVSIHRGHLADALENLGSDASLVARYRSASGAPTTTS
ncbi:MAG: hypothetical protein FJ096_14465 [Deltaproteobacteria bacterium]|nr:hypothetical protein [Deltaproteobacteria bacterium]